MRLSWGPFTKERDVAAAALVSRDGSRRGGRTMALFGRSKAASGTAPWRALSRSSALTTR